jgi:hypothetical protein
MAWQLSCHAKGQIHHAELRTKTHNVQKLALATGFYL